MHNILIFFSLFPPSLTPRTFSLSPFFPLCFLAFVPFLTISVLPILHSNTHAEIWSPFSDSASSGRGRVTLPPQSTRTRKEKDEEKGRRRRSRKGGKIRTKEGKQTASLPA
ncbi:hypothetical protein KC338_g10 [Hortaea werneckii]|nr:hypothetical protein KC338_g10 [Hortaea werneckii]